jgi:hypothetical protein
MTSIDSNIKINTSDFDLKPDPRVLPMLGEISIEQWRCVAELVDNAVDGFLKEAKNGNPISLARVDINLPQAHSSAAALRIIDNGPGMTPETLELAVRAGWSGNNPIDSLGLFGMGFNIATARLGSITEVWTTREGEREWHGLQIDFDKLRQQRHFRTPRLSRVKIDPNQHGTEITIKRLKPEQLKWLVKNSNQTVIRKRLSQSYSSMLRAKGNPISFELFVNHKRVEAKLHCLWNEDRYVPGPGGINIPAIFQINHTLADRLFCTNCMSWLFDADTSGPCPNCETVNSVVKRERKVTGWLGVQRYLDQSNFGIDFIRNGRKIEIGNKDLFLWNDGENEEREYPIDDPRNRGRIVGEIHIDHCRVSYAKDRFDRTDPAWDEMQLVIRGEGPLRPEKAKDLGFGLNETPLFQLFKAFRRSSPKSKTAGAFARILMVKDNVRSLEMVEAFNDGKPEFQDDSKWWELVEAADRELLFGAGPTSTTGGQTSPGSDGPLPPGLLDDETSNEDDSDTKPEPINPTETEQPPPPQRSKVPQLSRLYRHVGTSINWNVLAYSVEENDPDLPSDTPWALIMGDTPTKTYHFLFFPGHPAFDSITMTPQDALLAHLAYITKDQIRNSSPEFDFARILADFRESYGDETSLDLKALPSIAAALLTDVARCLVSACPQEERAMLFNCLSVEDQSTVMRTLAIKKIKPAEATINGNFLVSAPFEVTRHIIAARPDLCFDGKIWDAAYSALDYGDPQITAEARESLFTRYITLVDEVIWLSRLDSEDLSKSPRSEVIRSVMSLDLLKPDIEVPG